MTMNGRSALEAAEAADAAGVYDVIVIGGGIIGAMTAWKLSKLAKISEDPGRAAGGSAAAEPSGADGAAVTGSAAAGASDSDAAAASGGDVDGGAERRLRIAVIDKAYDVGEGAAKANSGILYPGIQARGGSLKGISCVQGSAMYDDICRELGVPLKRVGSLYTAFSEEGVEKMMKKYKRGLENGAPGMRIISGDEAREMEPRLSNKVIKAIYNPTTGIISPFALVVRLSEAAAKNGADFAFDCEALDIDAPEGGPFTVKTSRGEMKARYIVNASGGSASLTESMVRPQNLIIKPRRGQFYIFDKQEGSSETLRHVIYQAADSDEGGTLIAPTVEGNIIAGPTSENVRTFDNTDTTAEGLAHVERVAKKLLPGLDMGKAITNFAGVRANITNIDKEHKDFIIRRSARGMVSALGIKNPGMTSAPYLADRIIDILKEDGLPVSGAVAADAAKTASVSGAGAPDHSSSAVTGSNGCAGSVPFLQLDAETQQKLWEEDSRYGRVVCRCEQITEGDIVRALHSPLPPRSLNGLKKRLRVGMGRCQGSFCTARVIEIICRETGCRPEDILKSTDGSRLVKGRLK